MDILIYSQDDKIQNGSLFNIYNISYFSNENLEIYIRSYVFDKRMKMIRFFVEMPMVLIKRFMDSAQCKTKCKKHYGIPSKWIIDNKINLYISNNNAIQTCNIDILLTAQRVWSWKLYQSENRKPAWTATHCQVFIQCSYFEKLQESQQLSLEFKYYYKYNHRKKINIKNVDIDKEKEIEQISTINNINNNTIGLCVSSLFHPMHLKMINSFIEHYLSTTHFNDYLGGFKFHLYLYIDYKSLNISTFINNTKYFINDKVKNILLNKLNKEIFLIDWSYNTKNIYFGSQILSINDCIYRNMYKYKWILRYDTDEFLIIKNNQNKYKQSLIDILKSSFNLQKMYLLNKMNKLTNIYSYNNKYNFDLDLLNNDIDEISFFYMNIPIEMFINHNNNKSIVEYVLNKWPNDNVLGSILTKPINIVDQWVHYIRKRLSNDKDKKLLITGSKDSEISRYQLKVCKFNASSISTNANNMRRDCPVITFHFNCHSLCRNKEIWEETDTKFNQTFYEKNLLPRFQTFAKFN